MTSGPDLSQPIVALLSAKERDRLEVIQLVVQRRMTRAKAGVLLRISVRQIARLCAAYRRGGAAGLVSGKRGRIGNRKLSPAVEAQVIGLFCRFYRQLGPSLVRDKLAQHHGIKLAKETVRRILSKADLWQPQLRHFARVSPTAKTPQRE